MIEKYFDHVTFDLDNLLCINSIASIRENLLIDPSVSIISIDRGKSEFSFKKVLLNFIMEVFNLMWSRKNSKTLIPEGNIHSYEYRESGERVPP